MIAVNRTHYNLKVIVIQCFRSIFWFFFHQNFLQLLNVFESVLRATSSQPTCIFKNEPQLEYIRANVKSPAADILMDNLDDEDDHVIPKSNKVCSLINILYAVVKL